MAKRSTKRKPEDKKDNAVSEFQLSILDLLKEKVQSASPEKEISSNEIEDAITLLSREKTRLRNKEHEIKRQKQHEAEERRKQEAEKKRRDHVRSVTSFELSLDWENAFARDDRAKDVSAETPADGLLLSLTNLGHVDIEYISQITGKTCGEVISALKGSIYQNPLTWNECFYKGWETSDEYLSGNLMRKRKAAIEANSQYDGYFKDNIKALESVLPPAVSHEDIYITLGSPWIPADIIDGFIEFLFGKPRDLTLLTKNEAASLEKRQQTKHDPITGAWEILDKGRYHHSIAVTETYGTNRMEALYILEKSLNMRTIAIYDEVACSTNASGKARQINQSETLAALEKQQELIEAFEKWVWEDPERKKRLEIIFENNFSCVRRRNFDGSFLTFPNMAPEIELHNYQKDAVARIILSPNTLLAHDVGSGKTYIMIAAAMEMKRMGLSKKPLFVVPNNIVGQWRDIFLSMYPHANILCVEPKSFSAKKRGEILETIRNSDFDGIIIAYSCFERIPISLQEQKLQLEALESRMKDALNSSARHATNRLAKTLKKTQKDLAEFFEDLNENAAPCFDELGIDRLFIDEAHNFKNVPLDTKITHALGINAKGSKRCQDMIDKVNAIQRLNGGGGVVMATGTPITNSITDAFIMQKYLQPGELSLLNLSSFDAWVGMFAERVTAFEVDVDTSNYRLATRFSKFHNLPELTSLLASIADFHQLDPSAEIPYLERRDDKIIKKTPAFETFLASISQRADAVRHRLVPRAKDNMLKITTDGRLAALDIRLVDEAQPFTRVSKVNECAENVYSIWSSSQLSRSAQLVFCDSSTPKNQFNLYDELRQLLLNKGIPEDEIAFIHDASTEKAKATLFSKVRAGEVRVLLGSTFKLGIGVNVQDRLIALHHLDVPWRPADMTQREGRILRQGNMNDEVKVFRYITEGSFDAYSWQLLETKQSFIEELLSGSLAVRDFADINNTALEYAEVKALAIGNPLIKERVEKANELSRYLMLQKQYVDSREQLQQELMGLPAKIDAQRELIASCEADMVFVERNRINNANKPRTARNVTEQRKKDAEERRRIRESIHTAILGNEYQHAERKLMEYRGFNIVLPAGMRRDKPFLWIVRDGRYKVDLSFSEAGVLTRIDNRIDGISAQRDKYYEGLSKFEQRQDDIRTELKTTKDYVSQIEKCKQRIAELDRKLKVDER